VIGEDVELRVHLAPDLAPVRVDPGQMEQVVMNLAVNARDAMPDGGTLTVRTAAEDATVLLEVRDTGVGMTPEVAAQAFEPFFTTKPAGSGTGLGLATVYGIVTAAGGDLSIYSEPGMGTTFTILLPTTEAAPAVADQPAEALPENHRRATVLAVEDEPALREVLQRILSRAGHEVLTAADGPSALALAEAHCGRRGRIDVLLTDVVMPHMPARDLAARFAEISPGSAVLFMSGYARPVLTSQGTLDEDVALVEKPFSKAQLLAAVQHCLDR